METRERHADEIPDVGVHRDEKAGVMQRCWKKYTARKLSVCGS